MIDLAVALEGMKKGESRLVAFRFSHYAGFKWHQKRPEGSLRFKALRDCPRPRSLKIRMYGEAEYSIEVDGREADLSSDEAQRFLDGQPIEMSGGLFVYRATN